MRLRRVLVLDEPQSDRVEGGETLILRDGQTDRGGGVQIVEDRENLVLQKMIEVLLDEISELIARKASNLLNGHRTSNFRTFSDISTGRKALIRFPQCLPAGASTHPPLIVLHRRCPNDSHSRLFVRPSLLCHSPSIRSARTSGGSRKSWRFGPVRFCSQSPSALDFQADFERASRCVGCCGLNSFFRCSQ